MQQFPKIHVGLSNFQIGKSRLVTPCRGKHCTHIQCMDVATVLGLMMHRPAAKCPLCDKPVKKKTLYIDG